MFQISRIPYFLDSSKVNERFLICLLFEWKEVIKMEEIDITCFFIKNQEMLHMITINLILEFQICFSKEKKHECKVYVLSKNDAGDINIMNIGYNVP